MDFVEGLSISQGKWAILVVVDMYSKFAHFVALQHPYTTPKAAQILFEEVSLVWSSENNSKWSRLDIP